MQTGGSSTAGASGAFGGLSGGGSGDAGGSGEAGGPMVCPVPCESPAECAPFATVCTERDGGFECAPCPELSGIICILEYCHEEFAPAIRDGGQVGGGCDRQTGHCYCQVEWFDGSVTPLEINPLPLCP
jgi:hypothetical protein